MKLLTPSLTYVTASQPNEFFATFTLESAEGLEFRCYLASFRYNQGKVTLVDQMLLYNDVKVDHVNDVIYDNHAKQVIVNQYKLIVTDRVEKGTLEQVKIASWKNGKLTQTKTKAVTPMGDSLFFITVTFVVVVTKPVRFQ